MVFFTVSIDMNAQKGKNTNEHTASQSGDPETSSG
jgi:hypothetical protein